jgi:hypothetical protein
MNGDDPQYWFCLVHKAVEPREGCKNADRLGPYATAAEAEHALDRVAERNEEWDNDPVWNDPDEDEDRTDEG